MATWKKIVVSGSGVSQLNNDANYLANNGDGSNLTNLTFGNITNAEENIEDIVNGLIVGGTNISTTYDDAAGTLTIDADLDGDITSIVAGAGLTTPDGTSGDVTINVVGGDGITANADEIEVAVDGTTVELSATDGSGTVRVKDLGISTAKLAADAVTSAKIGDDQVDSEHINGGAIDFEHFSAGSVSGSAIADAGIGTAKLVDLSVTTGKIAADAINGTKIADDAVDSEHIAAGAIDFEHFSAGSVSGSAIADASIGTAKLVNDSVTNDKIANNAVGTDQIGDEQVTNDKLADNAVGTDEIANDAVTAAKLADTAVSAGSYGDASNIATFTVDAQGRLTAAGTVGIAAASFTLAADNGSNDNFSGGETVTFSGGNGVSTTVGDNEITIDIAGGIVSGSSIASSAQGQVALTTNGVAATAVDLGLQTGDSPTFSGLTISNDATINGDLTVNGTTVTVNTSNFEVEDRFIFLNEGSGSKAPAGEGGIIVEGTTSGQGEALFYDGGESRWSIASSISKTATSATPAGHLAVAYDEGASQTPVDKAGNIKIDSSDDIWIYV